MYYTGNNKVIEGDAIASMHQFELVTQGGEQYVRVLLKLDPEVRHYEGDEAPVYFAVTDGINVRLLSNVGLPATEAEAAPAPAPVADFLASIEEPVAATDAPAPEAAVEAVAAPQPADEALVAPAPTEAPVAAVEATEPAAE
ncbi:MAG: hypothetical protein ACXWQ5_00290 [Ktedonobacterales bacterium]